MRRPAGYRERKNEYFQGTEKERMNIFSHRRLTVTRASSHKKSSTPCLAVSVSPTPKET